MILAKKRRSLREFDQKRKLFWNLVIVAVMFGFAFSASAQAEPETEAKGRPVGTTAVYGVVVDNSGAFRMMIERVNKTLTTVVKSNDDGVQTFLITFIDPSKFNIRQEATRDKDEIADAIENIYAEAGRSTFLDGLKFAVDHIAEIETVKEVRRSLLIVTDGDDKGSIAKADLVIKIAKDNKVKLFFIGISETKVNAKLLDRLAKETGGSVFYPKTREEMQGMAETISKAVTGRQ